MSSASSRLLRYTEDLAFVLPDELLEGSCVPIFGARNQRYVWMDFFRHWGLDGRHEVKGAKNGRCFDELQRVSTLSPY
jgi:hypothetical protein